MKRRLILGAMLLATLTTGVRAGEEVKTGLKDGKPYFEATSDVTEQASVTAIDAATRLVTLKKANGETTEITAGDAVKNFAQIKVGDLVKIRYTEKLTVHVEAAGTPEMVTETTTGAAKLGDKPAASATERTQYKASIEAIDKANGTATLKSYNGETFVMTPLHPENLDKVSVGELVVFTYTEAVAASVEKVAAKKKSKK